MEKDFIATRALEIKKEVEDSLPGKYYNVKKNAWKYPSTQVGYKAKAVRAIFSDMDNESNGTREWKLCIKLLERCIDSKNKGLLNEPTKSRKRVAGAGPPVKAQEVRAALFAYFIDIRSALKARLPKKTVSGKSQAVE